MRNASSVSGQGCTVGDELVAHLALPLIQLTWPVRGIEGARCLRFDQGTARCWRLDVGSSRVLLLQELLLVSELLRLLLHLLLHLPKELLRCGVHGGLV